MELNGKTEGLLAQQAVHDCIERCKLRSGGLEQRITKLEEYAMSNSKRIGDIETAAKVRRAEIGARSMVMVAILNAFGIVAVALIAHYLR